jgi:formylglycine-generating enzyme required for sulfatase activity
LPTEAEWEYAARGGRKSITNDDSHPDHGTGQDYDYSGDNDLEKVGWYIGNNGSEGSETAPFFGTKSVRGKDPNALGLYDMSGNVHEWCWNWHQGYSTEDIGQDPVGPDSGSDRVGRGGYWRYGVSDCRVSYRNYDNPYTCAYNAGFRVVLVSSF